MTTRLLIVLPTWLGDAVMATPTLRLLRDRLPGAFIGGLARPGLEELFAGCDFFDELHIDRRAGVMGPKKAAAKIRMRRYDEALLLANSFSSALTARLAFIPRRIGDDRDGRGALLTDRHRSPRRRDVEPYARSATSPGAWAPVPACAHYLSLAKLLLDDPSLEPGPLELATSEAQERGADEILARAGLEASSPSAAILNPGGNNPAKRWPAERFIEIAKHLRDTHGLNTLVSGSPDEIRLVESIADASGGVALTRHGLSIGALKAVIRRCSLMLTNDTGPRHIAAAFGVPTVALFGPTDHRWTTIPFDDEIEVVADPSLPEEEVANDYPQRCAIESIEVARVASAVDALLARTGDSTPAAHD